MYGLNPYLAAVYFVSFMIVNAVILTNVALAVLLEKVIEDPDAESDNGASPSRRASEPGSPPNDRRKSNARQHGQ